MVGSRRGGLAICSQCRRRSGLRRRSPVWGVFPDSAFALVTSACGPRSDLIPGLDRNGRAATSLAVRGTSASHGPRSMRELTQLGRNKRSPCDGLAPPTQTNDQGEMLTPDGPGPCRSLNRHRCRVSIGHPSSADGRQHRSWWRPRRRRAPLALLLGPRRPGNSKASARRPRDRHHSHQTAHRSTLRPGRPGCTWMSRSGTRTSRETPGPAECR